MSIGWGSAAWHVVVLVPARNEQELLPRCLRSVARARRMLPAHISSDVVVISDSSTDGTKAMAQRVLGSDGLAVACSVGRVGAARALAARHALMRYTGPLNLCWLANTDADCEVPDTWLLDQVGMAEQGIVAAAGIVDVDNFEDHGPEVPERFRHSYQIYADGTHPHVHGANLGVRADAYLGVGGWADLATAEDHDLWARVVEAQYPRLSRASLRVSTSGRRVGRAPAGFADALAAHNLVTV